MKDNIRYVIYVTIGFTCMFLGGLNGGWFILLQIFGSLIGFYGAIRMVLKIEDLENGDENA